MIHLPIEHNYEAVATATLTDYLGLVDAQIYSAEDTLRVLNLRRAVMLGVLATRRTDATG